MENGEAFRKILIALVVASVVAVTGPAASAVPGGELAPGSAALGPGVGVTTADVTDPTAENFDACYVYSSRQNQETLQLVNKTTAATTDIGPGGTGQDITDMAFQPGTGQLFAVQNSNQLGTLSLTDGTFTSIGTTGFGLANGSLGVIQIDSVDGLGFNSVTGTLYAIHERSQSLDVLVKIDPATGEVDPNGFGPNVGYVVVDRVGTGNDNVDGLAFDPDDGQLYTVGNDPGASDNLVAVDNETGVATDVGELGINNIEGLTFDSNGDAYAVTTSAGGALEGEAFYSVDTATGEATLIGTLDGKKYLAVACGQGGPGTEPQADLSLDKTANRTTVPQGEDVAFTLTVTNDGPDEATGVTVEDALPSGLTFVSADPAASYDSGTGTWTVGSLAAGETATLTIVANATGAIGTDQENVAEVATSDVEDPDSTPGDGVRGADDFDSTVVTIAGADQADVSIVKTVNETVPAPGAQVTYTVTATNDGPQPADVTVQEGLPTGLSSLTVTPSKGSYDAGTEQWSVVLQPGESATLSVLAEVTASGGTSVANQAEVVGSNRTDPDSTPGDGTGDDFDEARITATAADLAVNKTVDDPTPTFGDQVTFTVTVTNFGPSNATRVVVEDQLPNGLEFASATESQGVYDNATGLWSVGTLAPGQSETLALTVDVLTGRNVTNTAAINDSDQFDPEGTNDSDSAELRPELDSRLRGEVQYQNGTPADNVTIQVVDLDTGTVVFDDIVTRGFDTGQPGTWGPIAAEPGNYTVELDDTGSTTSDLLGTVEVFSTQVTLESGETRTIETTLDRIRGVGQVTCSPVERFAGEGGTFTITVRDDAGRLLEGATVEAVGRSGSTATTLLDNTTKSTDGEGQVTYRVVANTTASTTFTFNVTNGGETVQVECSATFVRNGEGYLSGDVRNAETTGPIEGARVWAVLGSSYEQNQRYTRIDLADLPDDDGVVWVRLVDRNTGETFGPEDVIDNDAYDVRNEAFGSGGGPVAVDARDDTGIRLVEQINVSDGGDGQGFAVVDLDGDGLVAFNHTRLAPRDYFVQIALDAPNASRGNGVAREKQELPEDEDEITQPWGGERWYNVTFVDSSGTATGFSPAGDDGFSGFTTATYFSPPANLTYEQTVELARLADSNLVDAPGFVNSFGVDTAGTDVNGDFVLNKLFTDFQAGRQYVAIATTAGFSTDFHDVMVEEDGEITFRDAENREAFQLQPEPVEVDVNVTNLAVLPNLAEAPDNASEPDAYAEFYFDNRSDLFSQRLSRDGETVDVIQLDTTANSTGEPLNDTVVLSVPDFGPERSTAPTGNDTTFAGDFVEVAGGVVLGEDEVNNTITVATGNDGRAIVWLRTDFASEDLLEIPTFFAGEEIAADFEDIERCSPIEDGFRPPVEERPPPEISPEFHDGRDVLFSGVVARSTTDLDAADTTCKSFEGVTAFRNASISGFLSDRVDNRVSPTFVYVRNLRWDGGDSLLTIRPADDQDPRGTTYTVSHYEEDAVAVNASDTASADPIPSELVDRETNVTATGLTNYRFGAFPSIEDAGGPFKLAEFSAAGDSEFTLKPVPAAGRSTSTRATTVYELRGIALDRRTDAGLLEIGNASAATKPAFTDDANIAFDFRANAVFAVSDLDAPGEATNGSAFSVTADVSNEGTTAGTKDVQFKVDLDRDGNLSDEDALLSTSLQLGVGETEQVTFEVPAGETAALNGTYTHGVVTPDDSQTAEITITTGTGSDACAGLSSDVEAYAGSDCSVSSDELGSAIGDWAGGDISTEVLSEVIAAWAQSG